MRYRKLRIAFSAACGITCVLLIVMWVQSYSNYECLGVRIWRSQVFEVKAVEGKLIASIRNSNNSPNTLWSYSNHGFRFADE
jgi:hypothetical protein